jgi:hypothetical protein
LPNSQKNALSLSTSKSLQLMRWKHRSRNKNEIRRSFFYSALRTPKSKPRLLLHFCKVVDTRLAA